MGRATAKARRLPGLALGSELARVRSARRNPGGAHLLKASIQVELQHARQRVCLRLEQVELSPSETESLSQRIRDSLARSKNWLVLDLNKLQWDKVNDLRPLREKLSPAYRSRIRLVLPRLAAAHPEVILLATMFQHYKG